MSSEPTPPARPLAERIASLVERSGRVWAKSLDKQIADIGTLKPDPLNTAPAMARLVYDYVDHPQKLAAATLSIWLAQADLWSRATQSMFGARRPEPMMVPDRSDKRFKDEIWSTNPFYDYLKQSYLLAADWMHQRLEHADGLTPMDRRKLELVTRNMIEALAPTNIPALNPAVVKTTLDEKGENLLRGLENLTRDLERGHGSLMIRQSDLDAFKVGENMAITPGAVVYENEVMQLIQYAPTTAEVAVTPLVIVAPWINKFYIMDLNPKKSLIGWLVDQGHTVFVVSWINPDEHQRGETWESYMQKGVLTAIDLARQETGAAEVNLVGYCIGGTLNGTALAWLAAQAEMPVASATFFTTQLDFSDAGELQAFVDDEVIDTVETAVSQKGYLAAENMAGAFNSLRSTDLIWSFVINNYMMGKENIPFDLLYWNADSTCMPGQVHVFYLDSFYNKNALAKRQMTLGGVRLDLGRVDLPTYHVATVEDHIAPAPSAYRGAKLLGGTDARFILSGSGHIAGVVNPPAAKKYQYWTRDGIAPPDLATWREGTVETPGSWWPDWQAWLGRFSGGTTAARVPGATLSVIEPAPGRYVKVRFEDR